MMKRRIFAALLAAAMALSLAACSGGNQGSASSNPGSSSANGSGSSQPGSSSSDVSSSDGSQPDASDPDSSAGTASGSAGGSASSAAGLQPLPAEDGKVTITLNRTNIELNKAGATFRLRYTSTPDTDGIPSFTSSDTKVATVAEDGTIKAVAPGKATITVKYDGAVETCTVTCSWKVSQPAPAPDSSKPSGGASSSGGSSSSSGSSGSSSSQVDLQAFYDSITSQYEFGFLELADDEVTEAFYTGMTGVSTEQCLIYVTMFSMNNGEFCLVQVKDGPEKAKDLALVQTIFYNRISYMAGDGEGPGGAWYPGPTEQWKNNSRVVTNGDYVMMVVHESCDAIVDEFNALF